MVKKEVLLNKYTSPATPGSFSGISGFLKNNKSFINKSEEIRKLKDFEAYALHKQVKRKFLRRKTWAVGINHYWQIDLLDISKISYPNGGNHYLLTCIDVFRKKAWVEPVHRKTAVNTRNAFEKIIKSADGQPEYVYSDKGKEFMGEFKAYLKKLGIIQLFTKSIHKAAVVERFNRTIRNKIYRYMTFKNTNKFIDVLPELVDSYNNSYHRSIKMTPNSVNKQNEAVVAKNLYGDVKEAIVNFDFKIGDYVREALEKTIFEKGYTKNWSDEIFVVSEVNASNPPTYKLKGLDGLEKDWYFYKDEIQLVKNFPYDTFQIVKEKDDQVLVKKLNSNLDAQWISKKEWQKIST